MWVPRIEDRSGTRYRAIADSLADDMARNRLSPGTRLPTHRALAEALGVTIGTVSRAYAEAERRGLVEATVGRGTFVRGAAETPESWGHSDAVGFPSMMPSEKVQSAQAAEPSLIDLSVNYPVGAYLGAALAPALAGMDEYALLSEVANYQPPSGREEHRVAGVRWLQRLRLEADPEDILIVPGVQGGLAVALGALARPGDVLLTEAQSWPGLRTIAEQRQLRLVPVASDGEGLRPDALEAAIRRHGARLLYCMPTLHNPTNITMPEARRRDIMTVAAAEGLTVIEDDIYGFLAEDPPPPLAALDPKHAVYITSLSKCVAPGLRIGYLKAPRAQIPRLSAAMRALTMMSSSLSAEIASRLIRSGHVDTAARHQRDAARRRQTLAAEALRGLPVQAAPTSFHLWLPLQPPWDTSGFVREAMAQGVVVTPGDAFQVDPNTPQGVRLCLCAVAEEADLKTALDRLASLLARHPQTSLPVV